MHCRHDGTPFDAEVTLNVVEIRGEPHLLAVVRDNSERKRADAELALSRKTLMERNDSLRLINSLSTRLHGSLEAGSILAITLAALRGLTPRPQVTICLQEIADQPLEIVAGDSDTVPYQSPQQTAGAGAASVAGESPAVRQSDFDAVSAACRHRAQLATPACVPACFSR
jgi:hypothetical protein